jgi:hypothetical protein
MVVGLKKHFGCTEVRKKRTSLREGRGIAKGGGVVGSAQQAELNGSHQHL